jgi:hypothetical protein
MKTIDRLLQRWRIAKVRPYVSSGARVLDLGCADGVLFRRYESIVGEVIGIDPTLPHSTDAGGCRLIAGRFPNDLPDFGAFDAIGNAGRSGAHTVRGAEALGRRVCQAAETPGGHRSTRVTARHKPTVTQTKVIGSERTSLNFRTCQDFEDRLSRLRPTEVRLAKRRVGVVDFMSASHRQ